MTVYISRDDSYALEHHGVKGMKWGVRKAEKQKQKELSRLKKYASYSEKTGSDVRTVGESLSKHGSKSKYAGFIGDYNSTYGPGNNKAAKNIGALMLKDAKKFPARAASIQSLYNKVEKLDTSKMSKKDIKKYVNAGMQRINSKYDPEDWGASYTIQEYERYSKANK